MWNLSLIAVKTTPELVSLFHPVCCDLTSGFYYDLLGYKVILLSPSLIWCISSSQVYLCCQSSIKPRLARILHLNCSSSTPAAKTRRLPHLALYLSLPHRQHPSHDISLPTSLPSLATRFFSFTWMSLSKRYKIFWTHAAFSYIFFSHSTFLQSCFLHLKFYSSSTYLLKPDF